MTIMERMRNPFQHWTLRRKLVAAVVAIVAVLGVLVGLVSVVLMQDYLRGRLDQQLEVASQRGQILAGASLLRTGQLPDPGEVVTQTGQPGGTVALFMRGKQVVGNLVYYLPSGTGTEPRKINDAAYFVSQLGRLTVNGAPRSLDLGDPLRGYRVVANSLADGSVLVIGLPLAEVDATTTRLAVVIAIVTVAAGLFTLAAGLLIVQASLRPLERVTATAMTVSTLPLERGEVALGIRVPDADTDSRTEVGRVGSALNAMLGHVAGALQVRQASEAKVRQFVSDASHELRTPLASIRGYSELTRRAPEDLPEDVRRALGRIESEAVRMTAIVEDLLLLARLDEGRELDRESVDLTMLLINAVSDAHAAGPDHEWKLDVPEDAPVEVVGDGAKLHQVVANLLTNARVHTPAGTVVTAALRIEDGKAVIEVVDDGPGIPAELRPRLFERFARGDSSRSRATGSTGLGLAIAKAVVDAHDGEITVASEPGRTVFRITLPTALSGER